MVRTARRLDLLAGQVLTACQFRVPKLATLDLTGARVVGTDTLGKHLLTRLDLAAGSLTLHSHLGMDGAWLVLPVSSRVRVDHRTRVVWETATHRAVATELKTLALMSPAEEAELRDRLGPDILAPDFATTGVPAALARAEGRHDPVGAVLLDQTVAAGLGTVLASETLFLGGVAPARSVDEVDLRRLYLRGRAIAELSVQTGRRVTTGNLRRGAGYWVYGRENQPCRRCHTRIRRDTFSVHDRSLWWCPSCQPAG